MPVACRVGVLPSLITTCIIQPFQAQEPGTQMTEEPVCCSKQLQFSFAVEAVEVSELEIFDQISALEDVW